MNSEKTFHSLFPIQFQSLQTLLDREAPSSDFHLWGTSGRRKSLYILEPRSDCSSFQFPVRGRSTTCPSTCDRITELEEDGWCIMVIVRSYTRFHAPVEAEGGEAIRKLCYTHTYIYTCVYNGRRRSVQLKASGRRGRPLWVGLAEIRLNCWLREKISSVASVVSLAMRFNVRVSLPPLSRIPAVPDAVYRAAKLWTGRVD